MRENRTYGLKRGKAEWQFGFRLSLLYCFKNFVLRSLCYTTIACFAWDELVTKEKETTNAQHHLNDKAVYSKLHHLSSQ